MLGKRDEFPDDGEEVKDQTQKQLKIQNEEESDLEDFVQKFNPEDFVIEDDGMKFC